VDHRWPLAKGGTNRRGNLQPLCAPCNLSKGDRILWSRLGARWFTMSAGTLVLVASLPHLG
jgi:5-methylcytosine-specific restriction endonuclease McrA